MESDEHVTLHLLRFLTILAKTSFWAVCFHYFGAQALFVVAASWTFMCGIKDVTFARIRLRSIHNPDKRGKATATSIAVEFALLLLRLAILLGMLPVIRLFNDSVASYMAGRSLCLVFWSRETLLTLMRAYGAGGLSPPINFIAAAGGIASILYFAENNRSALDSAISALVIREALIFAGFGLGALAGRLGFRAKQDDFDEDEGDKPANIKGPGDRPVRSAWRVLIADNVVWSRWRIVQFATRAVASGLMGPFGNVGTRLLFTYKKPPAYKHRKQKVATWKLLLGAIAVISLVAGLVLVADRFGFLHLAGIAFAAILFRVVAHALNLAFWRRLDPLVGTRGKLRIAGVRRALRK